MSPSARITFLEKARWHNRPSTAGTPDRRVGRSNDGFGAHDPLAIRVMVVEDHSLVRAGLRSLLAAIPGLEVSAEAGGGREALRMLQELKVDVVVLDVGLPELNGLEVCGEITDRWPETKVVMISVHSHPEYVLRALDHGASGYLPKSAPVEELEAAIRAAHHHETYLGHPLSRRALDRYLEECGATRPLDRLTARQREVLQLIVEGRTSREIADHLYLSVKTVENHRSRIMRRLDIHDLASLVRFALRHGFFPTEEGP